MLITNLSRDSLFRNANVEYIYDSLQEAIDQLPNTTLILNANDPVSCTLAGHNVNKKVFIGVNDLHSPVNKHRVSDFMACPNCGAMPKYHYHNYRDIGDFYCPNCGFKSPLADIYVERVDEDKSYIVEGNRSYSCAHIGSGVHNIYNCAMIVGLFRKLDYAPEKIDALLRQAKVPESREEDIKVGSVTISNRCCKTHNATAVSTVLESIYNKHENIEVIMLLDEIVPDYKMETFSWIYDTDYEFLSDDKVKKVIVTGQRSSDQKLRLLSDTLLLNGLRHGVKDSLVAKAKKWGEAHEA